MSGYSKPFDGNYFTKDDEVPEYFRCKVCGEDFHETDLADYRLMLDETCQFCAVEIEAEAEET